MLKSDKYKNRIIGLNEKKQTAQIQASLSVNSKNAKFVLGY